MLQPPKAACVDRDRAGELVGLRRHVGHQPARRRRSRARHGRLAEVRRIAELVFSTWFGVGVVGAARQRDPRNRRRLLPGRHRPTTARSRRRPATVGAVVPDVLGRRLGGRVVDRRAADRHDIGLAARVIDRDAGSGPAAGVEVSNVLQSSEPLSPAAANTVCPCAAACSNSRFSACWRPGWPAWMACSHSPQLVLTTWSVSASTIAAYSSTGS